MSFPRDECMLGSTRSFVHVIDCVFMVADTRTLSRGSAGAQRRTMIGDALRSVESEAAVRRSRDIERSRPCGAKTVLHPR